MYLFFVCAGSSLLLRLFSSCGDQGLHYIDVARLLIAVASLVVVEALGHVGSVVQFPGSRAHT